MALNDDAKSLLLLPLPAIICFVWLLLTGLCDFVVFKKWDSRYDVATFCLCRWNDSGHLRNSSRGSPTDKLTTRPSTLRWSKNHFQKHGDHGVTLKLHAVSTIWFANSNSWIPSEKSWVHHVTFCTLSCKLIQLWWCSRRLSVWWSTTFQLAWTGWKWRLSSLNCWSVLSRA